MLLQAAFLLLFSLARASVSEEEFGRFINVIDKAYQERVKPQLDHIGRQADPCRVQYITGRFGDSPIPNSATKILTNMKNTADNMESGVTRSNTEAMRTLCYEALKHSRNWDLNVRICGQALAHYRARQSENPGRSSAGDSAWDELQHDLSESLSEEEILLGLNLWGWASLGILVDNTGSMADDIDQVTRVVENFLDSSLYDDDTIDNFVIMSFGDPDYEDPTSYYYPTHAAGHMEDRIIASMGGDCPEMTCQALEQMISYTEFETDSPIFTFTDASSKDCNEDIIETLEGYAISFGQTFNFVLTGVCGNHIDANFTRLATSTGGSVYRISESEIYDLRGIIAMSTESSSVISYETSDYEDEYWGRRRRRRRSVEEEEEDHLLSRRTRSAGFSTLSFYVDETVGRLTIQVTFEELADTRLLRKVTMEPRDSGCANADEGSRFGNIVHYAIDCPCVGEWVLKIPYSITNTNKWTFSARTFGEYSIGFDVMFEQVSTSRSAGSQYNEMTKEPCAGDRTTVWVTLYEDQSIDSDENVNIILTGQSDNKLYRLTKDRSGQWTTRMVVPTDEFSVAVRGTTVEGNVFLRILNTKIRPTSTCLKTERISPNHMTIKAGGETSIIMSLKSKDEPKRYDLYCLNDRRRDGFETTIARPVARYHDVQELNRYYYIYIKVKAPPIVDVGEIVNVKCYARSGPDKVYKAYTLMVSSVYS